MGVEKLFEKIENFFSMDKELQEKEQAKKEKLKKALEQKIESLKEKIQHSDDKSKRKKHKKQVELMKGFLRDLNEQTKG